MYDFWGWLFEVQQAAVSPSVLQGYEVAFKRELERLIQQTQDDRLRARYRQALDCPIRDTKGICRSIPEYVYSALLKSGIHNTYDIEAALSYVVEKLLWTGGESGEPSSVFATFKEVPGDTRADPLQGRIMSYLKYAIQNIKAGKIPRLSTQERRPQGTVSIGVGRTKDAALATGVSPDAIAAPKSTDADLGELVTDVSSLLRAKEPQEGLPLVQMFLGMMRGEKTDSPRPNSLWRNQPERQWGWFVTSSDRDRYRSGWGWRGRFCPGLDGDRRWTGKRPRRWLPRARWRPWSACGRSKTSRWGGASIATAKAAGPAWPASKSSRPPIVPLVTSVFQSLKLKLIATRLGRCTGRTPFRAMQPLQKARHSH